MCGRHDLQSSTTELDRGSAPVPSLSVPGLAPGPQAQSPQCLVFPEDVSEDTVLSLTLTTVAWLGVALCHGDPVALDLQDRPFQSSSVSQMG